MCSAFFDFTTLEHWFLLCRPPTTAVFLLLVLLLTIVFHQTSHFSVWTVPYKYTFTELLTNCKARVERRLLIGRYCIFTTVALPDSCPVCAAHVLLSNVLNSQQTRRVNRWITGQRSEHFKVKKPQPWPSTHMHTRKVLSACDLMHHHDNHNTST